MQQLSESAPTSLKTEGYCRKAPHGACSIGHSHDILSKTVGDCDPAVFMILLNYLDRVVLSLVSPIVRKEFNLTQMDYAVAINSFLIAYGVMYLGSGLVLTGSEQGGARILCWFLVTRLRDARRHIGFL